MIYDESGVNDLYEKNLKEAKGGLKAFSFYCGVPPTFSGLSGWVFEQTVQQCIRKELEGIKIEAKFREQVPLRGRAKIDLKVGKTAVEIKTCGLFSKDDVQKYKRYRLEAEANGWRYVFLSIGETTFREGIIEALNGDNVILLYKFDGTWVPNEGEWRRFMKIIIEGLTGETSNQLVEL